MWLIYLCCKDYTLSTCKNLVYFFSDIKNSSKTFILQKEQKFILNMSVRSLFKKNKGFADRSV